VPSDRDWRAIIRELNSHNDSAVFLTSGFWWVMARNTTGGGPEFNDMDELQTPRAAWLVRNADGSLFNVSNNSHQAWRGFSTRICHGSTTGRETLAEVFGNLSAMGVTLVSFDQEIGGGQLQPCYNAMHGHPPGFGPWMWDGFRHTMLEAKRMAAMASSSPFGMLMEQTSELSIPYVASFWSRQFAVTDYPVWSARGEGIFSYLYHEYITAMGAAEVQGQGIMSQRPDYRMRCRALANSLVRGLIQVPFANDIQLATNKPPPAKGTWFDQVRVCLSAFTPMAKAFPAILFTGEAGPPPAVLSPAMVIPVARNSGWGNITLPVVIAGTFRTPGQVATVLASASATDAVADVHLAEWWGGLNGTGTAVYNGTGHLLRRFPGVPPNITVALGAYGTRMIVITTAREP